MTKFAIGDTVIAVNVKPLEGNTIAPPLKLEEAYKVKIIQLDKKGNQHLDVGLPSKVNFVRSKETGNELAGGDIIWWCHPSRFIKVEL